MIIRYENRGVSHPTSSLRERIDNEFLVFFSPSLHCPVCLDKGTDIVDDILLLTSFLVKGHAVRCGCQRVQNCPDVVLGATGDTNGQV
jgi:hypothetical protein